MITKDKLLQTIKGWNPDTDPVNILKELIKQYGGLNEDILKIFFVMDLFSVKYGEFSCEAFAEHFGVIAIDFEGNCLYNDGNNVNSMSELQKVFENWIKEQESTNAA